MENEKKTDSFEKVENFLKKNKNIFLIILTLIIFIFIGFNYFNYYQNSKNEKISERFVQAGIYLSLNKKEKSKKIYKEIVSSKNKFYSLLALNSIIDNDLEQNSEEVLELFNIVENTKVEKEQKNLVKLKKALYLIKISKDNEGEELLGEIISDNSIWKGIASGISKQ
jgi:predicted negative regulator of RcsB-dependent stress response